MSASRLDLPNFFMRWLFFCMPLWSRYTSFRKEKNKKNKKKIRCKYIERCRSTWHVYIITLGCMWCTYRLKVIYTYIRYRHTSASVLGSHLYAICCYVHLQRLGFIDGWSRTLSSPSLMAKTRSIITCAHFKKKKRAALSLSHTILLLVCDFCLSANQK